MLLNSPELQQLLERTVEPAENRPQDEDPLDIKTHRQQNERRQNPQPPHQDRVHLLPLTTLTGH